MKVFGHRGFSGEYPENTMLAFQKAVEAGCEGIELDVQLTKDLVPVIMHDEKVDRTTDGNGYIYDLTYAELCKLDCSYPDKFAGKFGRLQIPTLREYLEWMAEEEDLITNIELKSTPHRSVRNGIGLEMIFNALSTELTRPAESSRLVQIMPTTTADITTGM